MLVGITKKIAPFEFGNHKKTDLNNCNIYPNMRKEYFTPIVAQFVFFLVFYYGNDRRIKIPSVFYISSPNMSHIPNLLSESLALSIHFFVS